MGLPKNRWDVFYGGTMKLCLVALALGLFASISPSQLKAELSAEEHASHHPEQGSSDSSQPGPGSGGKGMMGGGMDMGKMMEKMGAPKPKDLYPSLMNLPDLPLEKRDEVQRQAHERMKEGANLMSEGLENLSRAAPSDNYTVMQEATVTLREGLAQFESGLAAHRALAEGKAPKSVALTWFKRQMNLDYPVDLQSQKGLFGLPWGHFFVMFFLSGFAAIMIAMYFFKMKRATALLQKLVADQNQTGPQQEAFSFKPAVSAQNSSDSPESPAGLASLPLEKDAAAKVETSVAASSMPSPTSKKWSGKLQVARIFQETSDVKTFRFVSEGGAAIPFTYLPGQFMTLSVVIEGKAVKRSYTIASAPTQRYYCEITVKQAPDGKVSSFLHSSVKEGDMIEITAPSGKFIFSGTEADSIVLIGGGVGVTPLMSAIRHLTDSCWGKDIYLLYSCRTSSDFIFREELEHLQKRHKNLHVIATMTRAEGTVWMGLKGHLNKEVIGNAVPDIASRRVHLCGPPPMMAAIIEALKDLGVQDANIKTEAFGPAKKPVVIDQKKTSQPATIQTSVERKATVKFQKSNKSAELEAEETILEAADRVGVDIDNSCRTGSCGTCKVKLVAGQVEMECEDALEEDEKSQGMILACQAKSKNDVVVDA